MRYTEAKDRSAEYLRLALGHMGRHEAAFNPVTFTLWYEYVAGMNPRLSVALDALVAAKTSIDDPTAMRLFQEFVVPADEAAMRRISGELQRVMSDIGQSASLAGNRAGLFDAQLIGLSAALQANDMARLTPQLHEALAGTVQMKHSADALQKQVATGHEEISQLRSDLDRARSEALLDPLTGILNRKGFNERLQALLNQPAAAGQSHCLVMLDIDHFKKVNDTHGHVMGDRVIQGVGAVLRSSISATEHAAARYGGEEFALLLGGSSIEDGANLAEAVRLRTKAMKIRHRDSQAVLFSVTISGGVATMQPGDDASTLIARADAALYSSKRAGRDRVTRG